MATSGKSVRHRLSNGDTLVVGGNVVVEKHFPAFTVMTELLKQGKKNSERMKPCLKWFHPPLSEEKSKAVVGFLKFIKTDRQSEALVDIVKDKDGNLDVYVPKQEWNGANVEAKEEVDYIGTIHSHLCGAFFSGTDDTDDKKIICAIHGVLGFATNHITTSCRIMFNKEEYKADIGLMLSSLEAGEFPEEWKERHTKKSYSSDSCIIYSGGKTYHSWEEFKKSNSDKETTTLFKDWRGREDKEELKKNAKEPDFYNGAIYQKIIKDIFDDLVAVSRRALVWEMNPHKLLKRITKVLRHNGAVRLVEKDSAIVNAELQKKLDSICANAVEHKGLRYDAGLVDEEKPKEPSAEEMFHMLGD